MRANSLNRDMFKPFRSHNGLLRWVFGCVFEALHRFERGFLQRDASMRALWSDRPNCSHNVSQKFSGVNKSARERIGRQNLSQKVPSKKGSLGDIFSRRNCRENAHSKSANLREDALEATCSAGPFCLLLKFKCIRRLSDFDWENLNGGSQTGGLSPKFSEKIGGNWVAAHGGVTNGGLRGVWPPFLEIGRNRPFCAPFSAFFALFRRVRRALGKSKKTEEKGLSPQISIDLLKPPSLKPPFQGKWTLENRAFSGPIGKLEKWKWKSQKRIFARFPTFWLFLPIFIPEPISGHICLPSLGRRPDTYFLAGHQDRKVRDVWSSLSVSKTTSLAARSAPSTIVMSGSPSSSSPAAAAGLPRWPQIADEQASSAGR